MTVEDLQTICLAFPGVTQDIKWEDHLCFNIGGKMFMITSPDNFPVTASFKTSLEDFEYLTTFDGVIPAPYLARYHWVAVDDIRRFSSRQWQQFASTSYKLIARKLSGKIRQQLGINSI